MSDHLLYPASQEKPGSTKNMTALEMKLHNVNVPTTILKPYKIVRMYAVTYHYLPDTNSAAKTNFLGPRLTQYHKPLVSELVYQAAGVLHCLNNISIGPQ